MAIGTQLEGYVRGWTLKGERVARGLRAADVAARLRITRSRVTTIENQIRVSPDLAKRYRDALGPLP
jgi:transcriptional regulator with XRE-family HTH domain